MTTSTELIARIHVNIHEMRAGKPAISIRVWDPKVETEVAVHRCRRLRFDGPGRIVQDDANRLEAGARVWVELPLADIHSVDGKEPPWL